MLPDADAQVALLGTATRAAVPTAASDMELHVDARIAALNHTDLRALAPAVQMLHMVQPVPAEAALPAMVLRVDALAAVCKILANRLF